MDSEEDSRLGELEQQEQRINEYLKTLPYEVILQQRAKEKKDQQNKKKKQEKQKNKNKQMELEDERQPKNREAPIERSAKIRVNRFVKVFEDKQRKVVDPRFQDYAGVYNPDAAKKAFSFIPELQERQKIALKKSLSSKKLSQGQRQTLSRRYNQVTSSIQANKTRQLQQSVRKQHRGQISQQIKQGKTPFFKRKHIKKDDFNKRKIQQMPGRKRDQFIARRKQQTNTRLQNKKYRFQKRS